MPFEDKREECRGIIARHVRAAAGPAAVTVDQVRAALLAAEGWQMTAMTQSVKDSVVAAAIKAIQTRRRQVPGLADDDAWRDFLAAATEGERSLRAMDAGQLGKVADALTRASAPTGPGRSAALLPRDPQSRKLRALWITMGKAGVVKDRREKALCAWCARQLGLPKLDSLSFLKPHQRGRCINDLTQWAKSKGVEV